MEKLATGTVENLWGRALSASLVAEVDRGEAAAQNHLASLGKVCKKLTPKIKRRRSGVPAGSGTPGEPDPCASEQLAVTINAQVIASLAAALALAEEVQEDLLAALEACRVATGTATHKHPSSAFGP